MQIELVTQTIESLFLATFFSSMVVLSVEEVKNNHV